jgi:flagellar basal-body rod protein FlgG
MILSRQKVKSLISISLAFICFTTLNVEKVQSAAHAAGQNKLQAGHSNKLRELLKERYNILKTMVDEMKMLLDRGIPPGIEKLRKATIEMFNAEADLCTTSSERIKVFKKLVDVLRKQEEDLAREVTAGQRPQYEAQRARLARLEVQIRLEKERLLQKTSLNITKNTVLKTISDAREAVIENITNEQSIAYKKNIVHFLDNNTLVIKRDFSQGKNLRTDRPLDLAISGKGFFNVTDSKGRSFYTRYGSFLVRPNRMMVIDTGQILEPIISVPKDAQKIHITKDGSVSCITTDGKESVVGEILMSRFPNEEGLEYKGKGLYAETSLSGIPIKGPADSEGFGHIESGFVEGSNVDIPEQIRLLTELSRFEQSVNEALSIVQQESQWAKDFTLAPAQKPKDKFPVIVHIKTKNEVITVLSGHTEPLYNVTTKDGKVLGLYLSAKELQKNLPDIYRMLKTSYADDKDITFIWAGIDHSHP